MKVRYLIKFSKESDIKFIGHLDLMRTIQRMLKRSGLPLEYSKGFNPHINMSLTQPLAVGIYSCGDYIDVAFQEEVDEELIKDKLNSNAPVGIKIFDVKKIKEANNKKVFKSMAELNGAKYMIKIKYLNTDSTCEDMEDLLNMKQWNTIKKSKSGESEVDIKKMIKEIDYNIKDNLLIIKTTISCGSRENLSPGLLATFVQNNTKNADLEAFVDIMREEMYGEINNKLVPLYEYVKLI